jgi:hypothetical protein
VIGVAVAALMLLAMLGLSGGRVGTAMRAGLTEVVERLESLSGEDRHPLSGCHDTARHDTHRRRWGRCHDMTPTPDTDVVTSGPKVIRDERYGGFGGHLDVSAETHEDDEAGDDERPMTRQQWVAAQLRAGRRAGWIDEHGASKYGVTTRTIARDRMAATRPHRHPR